MEFPQKKPRVRISAVREVVNSAAFVVAVFVLMQLALPRSVVDGKSMNPNLQTGDYIVVSRINYILDSPQRGDIIVFNSPQPLKPDESPLIKRVIGVPGDVVEIIDLQVYLNGELLEEYYVKPEPCDSRHCKDNRWQLGPDEYFMMGDNRNGSRDSREFGPVPKQNIIGQALFRYWPPQEIGFIQSLGFAAE